METEHDIVGRVYAAKDDIHAADSLVREYLPFIKSETAKFLKRIPIEGSDDELGIAMFAFHETVMAYQRDKGAFLKLAATVIRNRLIDYQRKEYRHSGHLSLHQTQEDDEKSRTILEQLDTGRDEIAQLQSQTAAREEIREFADRLSGFGLQLSDLAENCPKQDRTMSACHRVLAYAKKHPRLLQQFEASRKLPISALTDGSGVEKKNLERHRKYLVGLLLAFTNGFEMIREHLKQIAPKKGGVYG